MVVIQKLVLRLQQVHLVSPLFVGDSFLDMEVVDFVAIEAKIVVLHHQKRGLDLLRRNNEFALLERLAHLQTVVHVFLGTVTDFKAIRDFRRASARRFFVDGAV